MDRCTRPLGEAIFGGIDVSFKHRDGTFTSDVLVSAPESSRSELLQMEQGGLYTNKATLKKYGGAAFSATAEWGCY